MNIYSCTSVFVVRMTLSGVASAPSLPYLQPSSDTGKDHPEKPCVSTP